MGDIPYSAIHENRSTLPGNLISAHYKKPFGYRVKRSRGTRDYYLTLTLSGHGRFHNGGESCICSKGDVTVITPGTPHYYATAEPAVWEFYWCHFVPREPWLPLLQLPEEIKGIKQVHVEDGRMLGRIRHAFSSLVEYNAEDDAFSERLAYIALEEVLLLLARCSSFAARQLDPRIESAIRLLTERYREPLTVPGIAAQVNLSPSRFAHLFKEQTGEAVMEMLIKLRLKHAKRLLDLTRLSVAEVAAETGFQNAFYFTRQFTAFCGCPPSLYRKQKL
ncbi:helix-turn-helix domain-containing protein [Paenibacillus filicis]|uniref:Helix-turn-helix domain-containing protein n=1 Tax=Paenibacillus gyeongsangnamensis TaxID=3388067 RepID=A0ABT4Q2G4_9BACL|nr:helix-turn-helix domain-containing protein [Paenibacillus filicis]MCZ8511061.1 helix-turn-helix domain-containing protein [Paenibacillus filicis]